MNIIGEFFYLSEMIVYMMYWIRLLPSFLF